jgi:splicing factor 3B subunit 3
MKSNTAAPTMTTERCKNVARFTLRRGLTVKTVQQQQQQQPWLPLPRHHQVTAVAVDLEEGPFPTSPQRRRQRLPPQPPLAAAAAAASNGSGGGVPVQAVAMKLLDLRLKPSSAIIQSVVGEFTADAVAAGQQEIAMIKAGGTLEIHRVCQTTTTKSASTKVKAKKGEDEEDEEEDEEESRRVETKSILRCLAVIRFPGSKRDVLALGADGGALSVLDLETSGSFKIVHCVDFGKTQCRRATPGQYLAVDPKGRACMIGSVEKRKLVYVLNRNAAGRPTIASPLEAHRPRCITFATVGLDNGYDNPLFATIELQYQDTSNDNNNVVSSSDDAAHGNKSDDIDANSTEQQLFNKQLAYYELDLGRNFVSRRWAASVHPTACCLAALPGGADGPGGVLVGGEDWIEYLHESMPTTTTSATGSSGGGEGSASTWSKITCPIPRRKLHPPNKGILITTITVQRQKKLKFFALAQSELGDVYKITIQLDPQDQMSVKSLQVALVDTLPTANSLNVCKKLGMLFCAAEFGDHFLYQFDHIDLPDAPTSNSLDVAKAFAESPPLSTSKKPTSSTMTAAQAAAVAFLTTPTASKLAPTFTPSTLRNLHKVFTLDNASPTTSIMVGELAGNEVSPQIYTLTGRGPTSAMRITRHGASVSELAVSELPGVPGGIFTVADNTNNASLSSNGHQKDRFIVVSFADATLVLSVGETVEEVGKESGFVTNSPTLACSALGNDGALCQVHPAGVRHIQTGNAKQWNCPGLKRIEFASANQSQVMIALAGGEVIIFELDPMNGNLTESAARDLRADVCCLDVGTIPKGRSRSLFAAVGCRDQTVRIVSLEPGSLLVQRSSTALKSRPHSVSFTNFVPDATTDGGIKAGDGVDDLALVIGLDDGSSLRASVDPVTGAIGTSPTRRFLGARPVSVSRITLNSTPATLLLSSRPWIGRRDATSGKHVMAPLSYVPLDHGCCFSTDVVREGIVATAGKTLRILSVDSSAIDGGDDEAFNTRKVELRYTPRQMTLLSAAVGTATGDQRKIFLAAVESDCNDYGHDEKRAMGFDFTGEGKAAKANVAQADDAMDVDSDDEDAKKEEKDKASDDEEEEDEIDPDEKEARKTVIRGPVPSTPGHWGSCVRLMNPADNCATLDCVEMGRNEAALCCASVRFHSKGGEPLLAVGTVTGMTLHPLKQAASHVVLYRVVAGERLQLVHRTSVDDGPVLALSHFQGRLLVGIGRSLRLYEMGRRQLLRKCELRGLPTFVKTLQTVGDRAYVGDMMQSVQIVRYEATSNRLVLIANDPSPRPIVCQELLDWNTVAVGDKFGNVSVLRLPRGADANAIDPTGHRALWDSSRLDTTPKLELLCQYYVGEVVTSMTRSSLVAGGPESLIYATVSGRIGALVPFTSRDDVDFYTQLESCLRADAERPTGRDPQEYRSYYAPSMHAVDGDLCDSFNALPYEAQSKIADGLDRTIGAIKKKLEDKRNALL